MLELDIKGKNFVFVGGSHDIGKATALELAKPGGSILIVSRGEEAGLLAASQALALGATEAEFLSAVLVNRTGH